MWLFKVWLSWRVRVRLVQGHGRQIVFILSMSG